MLDTVWDRVEQEVAAVLSARPKEYDPATLANLRELIDLLISTGRPAPVIGPGYWPTFRVTWSTPDVANLEIEVFEDRYEVYRFVEGSTNIWYEHHLPGQAVSSALVSELPRPE